MRLKRWNWFIQDNANRSMKTLDGKPTLGDKLRKREIFKIFIPLFPKENRNKYRILDVGCGVGRDSIIFKRQQFKVHGVCLSGEDAIECKKKNINAYVCDMHELFYDDNSFSGVFCAHTLEHAIAPYIALCEFNRVLVDNGFLYVSVPEPDNKWTFFPTHYSVLHPKQMLALAFRAGFELIKFIPWRFKGKKIDHNQDCYIFKKKMNYKDVDRSYKPGDVFYDYDIKMEGKA